MERLNLAVIRFHEKINDAANKQLKRLGEASADYSRADDGTFRTLGIEHAKQLWTDVRRRYADLQTYSAQELQGEVDSLMQLIHQSRATILQVIPQTQGRGALKHFTPRLYTRPTPMRSSEAKPVADTFYGLSNALANSRARVTQSRASLALDEKFLTDAEKTNIEEWLDLGNRIDTLVQDKSAIGDANRLCANLHVAEQKVIIAFENSAAKKAGQVKREFKGTIAKPSKSFATRDINIAVTPFTNAYENLMSKHIAGQTVRQNFSIKINHMLSRRDVLFEAIAEHYGIKHVLYPVQRFDNLNKQQLQAQIAKYAGQTEEYAAKLFDRMTVPGREVEIPRLCRLLALRDR